MAVIGGKWPSSAVNGGHRQAASKPSIPITLDNGPTSEYSRPAFHSYSTALLIFFKKECIRYIKMTREYEPLSIFKKKKREFDADDDSDDQSPPSSPFMNKIRSAIFLFIVFLLLSSDVFIDQALSRFNGAVDAGIPTSIGVVIQGIFLVVGYILIDTLTASAIL